MSYDEGADVVPLRVGIEALSALGGRSLPDNYDRVQRLTARGYKNLVAAAHDRSYLVYGELSGDFPLCADFASICAGDVLREAVKDGLAVRPFFGVLYYTKNAINAATKQNRRHAINFAGTVDGRVLFFEPQTDTWRDEPEDCASMDEFRLL